MRVHQEFNVKNIWCTTTSILDLLDTMQYAGFPQGLENREKNNGQGKVREFYFGPKVREKSRIFFILGQKSGYFFQNGSMPRFQKILKIYLNRNS